MGLIQYSASVTCSLTQCKPLVDCFDSKTTFGEEAGRNGGEEAGRNGSIRRRLSVRRRPGGMVRFEDDFR